MAQVLIRKALQIKNRLAGEVAQLGKLIQANNSHRDGQSKFDVGTLLVKRRDTVLKLVAVKTALALANVKIYERLARMAELKNEITLYRNLNTTEGEEYIGYGETSKTVKIVAIVTAVNVETYVNTLNLEIEKIQDEVDYFNSTTEITIPD